MEYIPTIGLEIHAELKTKSKMFCSCRNNPDEETPNANICSICLGHPGTLPVLNKEAIKHVLRVGIAVGGTLADFTEWDRKNYFYPDIPKGYQISQYKYPLVSNGSVAGVGLERIHLEEDTAQSTHDQHEKSLVNFNRAGVPLMELVTKPVIHDAETAVRFGQELQLLLRYLGAGEANMEKGEMRVEANISVASAADTAAGKFGTKTEVKNLNSFRSVGKAIEYEVKRQSAILNKIAAGDLSEKIVQETRGWDDANDETYSQRSKESSHDYRYFPDPDLPKMKLSEIPEFSHEALAKTLPELPWQKRDRYKTAYAMTDKEAEVFVQDVFEMPTNMGNVEGKNAREGLLTSYFQNAIKGLSPQNEKTIRLTINYLLTDYTALLRGLFGNEYSQIEMNRIKPKQFAEMINLINAGKISSRGAKDIMAQLIANNMEENHEIEKFAERNGLIQKSDAGSLAPIIDKVIADNAKAVGEYKAGKLASLQFLIGMAMKASKGAGNPEVVKKMLEERLN